VRRLGAGQAWCRLGWAAGGAVTGRRCGAAARASAGPPTHLLADGEVGVAALGVVPAADAQLQRAAPGDRAALEDGGAGVVAAVIRQAGAPVAVASAGVGGRRVGVHPRKVVLGPGNTWRKRGVCVWGGGGTWGGGRAAAAGCAAVPPAAGCACRLRRGLRRLCAAVHGSGARGRRSQRQSGGPPPLGMMRPVQ
jgi:hypothetical protein